MVIYGMSLSSFNRIATRERHDSANQLIDRIIALRPDLRHETFIVPRSGNTSLTVMTVNEVFKSCMSRGNPADFAREIAVLEHLQGREMGADIPRLTWKSQDASIYGMTRMHGQALSKGLLAELPVEEQVSIAQAIGTFNAVMARSITDEQRSQMGLRSALYAEQVTPAHVFEALEPDGTIMFLGQEAYHVAQQLAQHHAKVFDTPAGQAQVERLMCVHPDMHENNLLYDRATRRLAVIDIGTGELVETHMAFCIPRQYYPRDFMVAMLQAFSTKADTSLNCAHLDVYYGLRSLKLSLQNPVHALGEFKHHLGIIKRGLDVLEGRAPKNAELPNQPAPTPYVPSMR